MSISSDFLFYFSSVREVYAFAEHHSLCRWSVNMLAIAAAARVAQLIRVKPSFLKIRSALLLGLLTIV